MTPQTAYIGTYTDGSSEGIYSFDVDQATNSALCDCDKYRVPENPSFLAISPNQNHLYAVHEVTNGRVSAFAIDHETQRLNALNTVDTGESGPCHCSVHPSGDFLFVAHYDGAAVALLEIADDGRLGPISDIVHHDGSSRHPARQTQAHPHSVTPGPDGRFQFVPDLGTDEIVIYELDLRDGALNWVGTFDTHPGAGPRHLSFHPNGQYLYVINELNSTISALQWDAETGSLNESMTESMLPSRFDGENTAADVHVHPSGQWVYGSNRGHDSIAVFAIDELTGEISLVDHESTRGEWPRNFAIDPSGEILFAQNQKTGDIVPFDIDAHSGTLSPRGESVSVPSPVCMTILSHDS